jgi:DivIVA domain-containing protein
MDSSPAATSILDTLRTVEFRLGLKGYNVDEVDEYLDRAAQEAEALQENVRQLNERLRQAGDRISLLEREKRSAPVEEPAPVAATAPAALEVAPSDETLQRTLILAQKFVDQIKRESEAEAASTVAQAEERARSAVARAEEAARTLQADSQKQVRDEVTRLELTRNELAADVESMARHLESERNRLRDALTEILKWVDENVQPANSLMGVGPSTDPAPLATVTAPAAAPATPAPAPASSPATKAPAETLSDVEAPTLNLQTVTNNTAPGTPHST